ncbi:MAG: DJ-1/PfpI family protein [Candidatus Thiodiazotropha sp. (ex Epidulcina cf. delphinae)]|nr:DJ-1/PfpI family protein [Candidatus Thiodiazotropha sp. (ex Epidulcina cf. delphinae)]
MRLTGHKIGVLFESDFFENEIFYYQFRFPEEGAELHLLSRLWDQERITFEGHEFRAKQECWQSFEDMSDEELAGYSAIIIPSGIVSDRLRYTDDIAKLPPACSFLERAFANENIVKGIICHGMWLMAPIVHLVAGRRAVVHPNLLGDAKAYGIEYVDDDVVVDGDLVTARTGHECAQFARTIIERIAAKGER